MIPGKNGDSVYHSNPIAPIPVEPLPRTLIMHQAGMDTCLLQVVMCALLSLQQVVVALSFVEYTLCHGRGDG
jgi:hypothetical protein